MNEAQVTKADWLAERAAVEKQLAASLEKARERDARKRAEFFEKKADLPIQWCLKGTSSTRIVSDRADREGVWKAGMQLEPVDIRTDAEKQEDRAKKAKTKGTRVVSRKKVAEEAIKPLVNLVAPAAMSYGKTYAEGNTERQAWLNAAWAVYDADRNDQQALHFLKWNVYGYVQRWFKNRQYSPTKSIGFAGFEDETDWTTTFMIEILTTLKNGLKLAGPFAHYLNRSLSVFADGQMQELYAERNFQQLCRDSAFDELGYEGASVDGDEEGLYTGHEPEIQPEPFTMTRSVVDEEEHASAPKSDPRFVLRCGSVSQFLGSIGAPMTEKEQFLRRVWSEYLYGKGENGKLGKTAKEIAADRGCSEDKINRAIGMLKTRLVRFGDRVGYVTA